MNHYSDIPGFDGKDYIEFMEIFTHKWNLPNNIVNNCDFYFLRHWTAKDIDVSLSDRGIRMFGIDFIPVFNKGAKIVFERELRNHLNNAKFWLSFRAIHYPVGTTYRIPGRQGNLRAYVIIQAEDKTS